MKKSVRQFLLLSLCSLAGSVSWAQVSLGVRGGANFATLRLVEMIRTYRLSQKQV